MIIDPCAELPLEGMPDPMVAAKWAWVVIIVAVLAFELVMIHQHRNTLSQYVQHKGSWFRWLAIGLVTILGLHLWGLL